MAGRKKATTKRRGSKEAAPEEPETNEEQEGEGDDEETQENGDPERPELSAKEKGALFVAYQEAADTLGQVEEALASAKEELGEAVKDIFDKVGQGPFRWRGKVIKVTSRKGRYYMRTESIEAEDIEDEED